MNASPLNEFDLSYLRLDRLVLYEMDTRRLNAKDPWVARGLWRDGKSRWLLPFERLVGYRPKRARPFFPHTDNLVPFRGASDDLENWFPAGGSLGPVWNIIKAFKIEGFSEPCSVISFDPGGLDIGLRYNLHYSSIAMIDPSRQIIGEARIIAFSDRPYIFFPALFSVRNDGTIIASLSHSPNTAPGTNVVENVVSDRDRRTLLKSHRKLLKGSAREIGDVFEFQQHIHATYVQDLVDRGVLIETERSRNAAAQELRKWREIETSRKLCKAIESGNTDAIEYIFDQLPEFKTNFDVSGDALESAVNTHNKQMVKALLEAGVDINLLMTRGDDEAAKRQRKGGTSRLPLCRAISKGDVELCRFLLDHGADPNLGRMLIFALDCKKGEVAIELVKLLVEAGVDVNQQFTLYGDENALFTALDWSSRDVEARRPGDQEMPAVTRYLLDCGAKTAREISPETALFN